MASIGIDRVSRSFGAVRAVDDVSITIADGEFFTLLGPSGCGKTTLLRMVAGFAELESGEMRFGARRIDTLPPHKRNTGMVFQNYAIFPNLTVGGNVAYGLKARGRCAQRDRRARRCAPCASSSSKATTRAGRTSSPAASCSASRSPAPW